MDLKGVEGEVYIVKTHCTKFSKRKLKLGNTKENRKVTWLRKHSVFQVAPTKICGMELHRAFMATGVCVLIQDHSVPQIGVQNSKYIDLTTIDLVLHNTMQWTGKYDLPLGMVLPTCGLKIIHEQRRKHERIIHRDT